MGPTAGEPVTILLVEDNPGDVRLTREAFEGAAFEAEIHSVPDGEDALTFLSRRGETEGAPYPDLILLDLNLPRMDGFAVLEALQDDPELASLPVLVLTSSTAEEDVHTSYGKSANAYLTKPDDPDEFTSLVRAVEEFWFDTAKLPPAPS